MFLSTVLNYYCVKNFFFHQDTTRVHVPMCICVSIVVCLYAYMNEKIIVCELIKKKQKKKKQGIYKEGNCSSFL